MTHVTCRLTAKNRDYPRNPTLGNRIWAALLFTLPPTTKTDYKLVIHVKQSVDYFHVSLPEMLHIYQSINQWFVTVLDFRNGTL